MEYLPIFLPIAGVIIQVALWIYWGGRLSERVDGHDKRIGIVEAGLYSVTQIASGQTTNIAVQLSKLEYIKATVEEIKQKLERKR